MSGESEDSGLTVLSRVGRFEGIRKDFAFGWALDPARPGARLSIEILDDEKVIAAGVAAQPHKGLMAKHIGDGRYAFLIKLPMSVFDGEPHVLRARDSETGVLLPGEQVVASSEAAQGEIEGIAAGVVFGWMPETARGSAPVIEVRLDDQPVGKAVASLVREDIAARNFAGAARGFSFDLTPHLVAGAAQQVSIFDAQSNREVPGTRLRLADHPGWGVVDSGEGLELGGWLVLTDPRAGPGVIEVEIDGKVVAEVVANRLRTHLRKLGVQRTRCGFSYTLPPECYDAKRHALVLRLKGTKYILRGGKRTFSVNIQYGIEKVERTRITGWILNAAQPAAPVAMDVWEDGKLLATVVANLPRKAPGTAEPGGEDARAAGFEVTLPEPPRNWTSRTIRLSPHGDAAPIFGHDLLVLPRDEVIRQAESVARHAPDLNWIMPGWVDELRRGYEDSPVVFREVPVYPPLDLDTPVDVIVPVHSGMEETLACLRSVLNTMDSVAFELVVINDASPEPSLTTALRGLAEHAGFTLLENPRNLGFVATANRGMRLHPGRDVILLNSDTVVPAGDWVNRLRQAAYAAPDIATVTPFSNRATICSLPRNLADNRMPPGATVNDLDALCSTFNQGVSVDIPTAVGFCMYVKRAALVETGLFDEQRWGKGYGEENDFCMRSAAKGWRHVAACDVFVEHHGSVSFRGDKHERIRGNLAILNGLYPDYAARIDRYIAADPLSGPRSKIVLDLLRQRSPRYMLHVTHRWGGGIDTHVRDLCRRLEAAAEEALILRPCEHGWIELVTPDGVLAASYPGTHDIAALAEDLRSLGVWHLHFHQTIGLPLAVWRLPQLLDVAFDFTVHDYFAACPRVNLLDDSGRFCNLPPIEVCEGCVTRAPLNDEIDVAFAAAGASVGDWRSLQLESLRGARRIFAPSKDAARHFQKVFDLPQVVVHAHLEAPFEIKPYEVSSAQEMRIAVIGAIGAHKGADLLLRTAHLAQSRSTPVRFVIVGYAADDAPFEGLGNVDILGAYAEDELAGLLRAAGCEGALFLSPWPETWSYTLSEALRAGLWPIATDLGAPAERIRATGFGTLLPPDPQASDVLDAILALRSVKVPGKRRAKAASPGTGDVVRDYYGLR